MSLEHLEPIEAREKREKQPWDYSHVPLPTSCLRAWQIHNSNQPASELQIPMGIAAVTFLLPVLATPPWSLLIIELGAPLALAAKKACKKMWMNMLWHGYAHFESIEQAAQMERSMGLSFLWPANNGWFVREGEWRWMEHIWGVPWLRSKNAEQKPDFHGFPTSLSLLNTLHDILTDGPVWNCPTHVTHVKIVMQKMSSGASPCIFFSISA